VSRIKIAIGDKTCTIDLLDKEAPQATAGLRKLLPLETVLGHAKFAGEELIFMVPEMFERENIVGSVSPGDVAYYPDRQTICIFYGGIVPFAKVALVGKVTQGLDVLRAVGPSVWQMPTPITVTPEA
jgi:hypothetical protein